jgi:hypothetical protein
MVGPGVLTVNAPVPVDTLNSSTGSLVLNMAYDGDNEHRENRRCNKNRQNPARAIGFRGSSRRRNGNHRGGLSRYCFCRRHGCGRNWCGSGPRLATQLDHNRVPHRQHAILCRRREIQHNARNARIRTEKSDANIYQLSTIDEDFVQTCAGQRFWEVNNQPVRVSHSLSAKGDGHGGGNLDVQIVIAAGDSNVANGGNLLARLNWNAVQLHATGKQNRTDG